MIDQISKRMQRNFHSKILFQIQWQVS
jgi:hypothetical protein